MLSAMFFGLFLAAMVYVRVDLSLSRAKKFVGHAAAAMMSASAEARVSELARSIEAAVQQLLRQTETSDASFSSTADQIVESLSELKKVR